MSDNDLTPLDGEPPKGHTLTITYNVTDEQLHLLNYATDMAERDGLLNGAPDNEKFARAMVMIATNIARVEIAQEKEALEQLHTDEGTIH